MKYALAPRPYAVWEAFETMKSSIEADRKLLTSYRASWSEIWLTPLRTCRTCVRWTTILVLTIVARRSTTKMRMAEHD